MEQSMVTIELNISEKKAEALAYFCKRIIYEDAYRHSHGENKEEREAMARRILGAICDVERGLHIAGFCPR